MLFYNIFISFITILPVFINALPVANSNGISKFIKRAPSWNETHSESFGLITIHSGSPIQNQGVIISDGSLFVDPTNSNGYSFTGAVLLDGSLRILPNVYQAAEFGSPDLNYYLTVDGDFKYTISNKKDPSFSLKDGHLLYKSKNGAYAVPVKNGDNSFKYLLKFYSDDDQAIGVVLHAVTNSGGSPADFP